MARTFYSVHCEDLRREANDPDALGPVPEREWAGHYGGWVSPQQEVFFVAREAHWRMDEQIMCQRFLKEAQQLKRWRYYGLLEMGWVRVLSDSLDDRSQIGFEIVEEGTLPVILEAVSLFQTTTRILIHTPSGGADVFDGSIGDFRRRMQAGGVTVREFLREELGPLAAAPEEPAFSAVANPRDPFKIKPPGRDCQYCRKRIRDCHEVMLVIDNGIYRLPYPGEDITRGDYHAFGSDCAKRMIGQKVCGQNPEANPLATVPRRFWDSPGKAEAKRELGKLFLDNWERLAARARELGGAAYLPKHKISRDSGQLYLFPEISEVFTPKQLRREYGCGHYGCVYATDVPGVVFKITTDETEARFIAALIDMDLNRADLLPGLTEFYGVFELMGELGGEAQAFAMWREESVATGDAAILRLINKNSANMQVRANLRKQLFQTIGFLMNDYLNWSQLSRQSFLESQLQEVLNTARHSGQEMTRVLAETFLVLAEHGLALTDAHYQNIGLVNRPPPWKWYLPVVTDVGRARFFTTQMEDFRIPQV